MRDFLTGETVSICCGRKQKIRLLSLQWGSGQTVRSLRDSCTGRVSSRYRLRSSLGLSLLFLEHCRFGFRIVHGQMIRRYQVVGRGLEVYNVSGPGGLNRVRKKAVVEDIASFKHYFLYEQIVCQQASHVEIFLAWIMKRVRWLCIETLICMT